MRGNSNQIDDRQLLRQYVQSGSEAAFSKLVQRHLTLVYTTCLRELHDPALAEDVTQVVFIILARKARNLQRETLLTGWLFNTARFASKNARRREQRHKVWESGTLAETVEMDEKAVTLWHQVDPCLNEALSSLGHAEREAVLLRFFEDLTFAEIGASLGLSEDAARMRLTGAVNKMARFFAKQGIVLSGTALLALSINKGAEAIPVSVAQIATSVIAHGRHASLAASTTYTHVQGVLQAMRIVKIKMALVAGSALLVGGLVAPPAAMHLVAMAQGKATSGGSRNAAIVTGGQAIKFRSQVPATIRTASSQKPETFKTLDQAYTIALDLRGHLTGWARSNKELLKKMMQAGPNDLDVVAAARKSLGPPRPIYAGDPRFGTGGQSPDFAAITPITLEHLRNSHDPIDEHVKSDFAKYHDFRVSTSLTPGPSHITLWATGRITVTTMSFHFVAHGKPARMDRTESADKMPVYDFLQ